MEYTTFVPENSVVLDRLEQNYLAEHPNATPETLAYLRRIGEATLRTIEERGV